MQHNVFRLGVFVVRNHNVAFFIALTEIRYQKLQTTARNDFVNNVALLCIKNNLNFLHFFRI